MVKMIGKDKIGIFWILLTLCAAVVFHVAVMGFEEINILDEQAYVIGLGLTVLFMLAGMIVCGMLKPPHREPDRIGENVLTLAFALVMIGGLMALRGTLLYFQSGDYVSYLGPWVAALRELSVRGALSANVGNYNMPYMYILLIISRIDFPPLILMKFASMFFDVILAYFVMKLAALRTESLHLRLAAFIGALAIPTVILNSAMWAQSDSIYAAFAMGAIYFGLSNKSRRAYLFLGLAFSFKMQALFVLPLFFVFILKGKVRLRDVWIFPVTFLGALLPALLAGMPPGDALVMYFVQFDYYSMLNVNAVNIWRLVGWVHEGQFITAGLFLAGTALTALLYFIYVNREKITKTGDYVYMAYLFAAILPFLLPKMHDRFLFMADVLSLLVFAYNRKRWFVPLVTISASYVAYAWYLMGQVTVIDYLYMAIALGVVILVVLKDFVERVYGGKEVY